MTAGPRVRIVQLGAATLAALARGDLVGANAGAPVPLTAWLAGDECRATWQRRAEQVVATPRDADWVTGVVVDEASGAAVGRAGFHAAPADGVLEVGYAIDPAVRRQGYGRATLGCLLERAAGTPGVRRVLASVSPGNVASLALVRQFGFVEVGTQWDDEDGLEIVHELVLPAAP